MTRAWAVSLLLLAAPPAEAGDADRIQRAVDHLLAAQLPTGLFAYGFDFLASAPPSGNHIARQVGVAYFLAEYYLHSRDERVRSSIETALATFGELSLPIQKGTGQGALERTSLLRLPLGRYKLRATLDRFGLLYRPAGEGRLVTEDKKYRTAFAGATALALLAELQYSQGSRSDRFRTLRAAWLTGLLALHLPGRGFRELPESIDEGDYPNAQGWFALAYYHALFPGDQMVRAVVTALDPYLIAKYADQPSQAFYHWGAMASSLRLKTTSDSSFLRFIRQQAEWALRAPWWRALTPFNTCAAVEGLAASAGALQGGEPRDGELVKALRDRIDQEMKKNRQLQVPADTQLLEFGPDSSLRSPHLEKYAGAFLEGRFHPKTAVDYTGHCLSAMLKLDRYGLSGER